MNKRAWYSMFKMYIVGDQVEFTNFLNDCGETDTVLPPAGTDPCRRYILSLACNIISSFTCAISFQLTVATNSFN